MRVSGIGGARWPGDGTGGVVMPTGAGAIAIVGGCVILCSARSCENSAKVIPSPTPVSYRSKVDFRRSTASLVLLSSNSLGGATLCSPIGPANTLARGFWSEPGMAIAIVAPRARGDTIGANCVRNLSGDANCAEEPLIANGWGGDGIGGSVSIGFG